MDSFGGVAFELAGGPKSVERFIKLLKIIKRAARLGGVESLVSAPRYTSHAHLSADQRSAQGVPDGFVRMSVGIEDAADLIADLAEGME